MRNGTVVVPAVPVGTPRARESGGVVTKFGPIVFPVAFNAVETSYVVYAVRGAEGTRGGVRRGFSPMSTTFDGTGGAIKVGTVD